MIYIQIGRSDSRPSRRSEPRGLARLPAWLKQKFDHRPFITVVLTVIALLSIGAVSNLGPISSLFNNSANPLADPQADITYTVLDELAATDGTGLNELKTTQAVGGATVSFTHNGAGAPTEGVRCVYELHEGTATQVLPQVVLPKDYDATTNPKYWQMVGPPQVVGGTFLIQNLESGQRDEYYRVGIRNANGQSTLEVGNSVITLND